MTELELAREAMQALVTAARLIQRLEQEEAFRAERDAREAARDHRDA